MLISFIYFFSLNWLLQPVRNTLKLFTEYPLTIVELLLEKGIEAKQGSSVLSIASNYVLNTLYYPIRALHFMIEIVFSPYVTLSRVDKYLEKKMIDDYGDEESYLPLRAFRYFEAFLILTVPLGLTATIYILLLPILPTMP